MRPQYNPYLYMPLERAREYARLACSVMLLAENDAAVMRDATYGRVSCAVRKSDPDLYREILDQRMHDIFRRVAAGLIEPPDFEEPVPGYKAFLPWYDSHYVPLDEGLMTARRPSLDEFPDTAPVPVQPKPETTPTMSKPSIIKIETRIFINDSPASGFTVDQLYVKIKEQQAAIADLCTIEPQPKRLAAEIEARKAGVQALVDYIDSLPA